MSNTALTANDFDAFFQELHGHDPFPWQRRLARRVCDTGWPAVLDLPTGTGKTAALDIALFHLAVEAGSRSRKAPLRIVYVVDRRTIVDQTHERAKKLVAGVREATGGILARVRARLEAATGPGLPLQQTVLRGGIVRSDLWARTPDQPLLAISTVDQVGSRLLFRGYGVSPSMRPIHAGLLGNDVLFLLDEVHLSHPFAETLRAVQEYQLWSEDSAPNAAAGLPRRFVVVEMSATPVDAGTQSFALDAEDRSHPLLAERLGASKPTTLLDVPARSFVSEVRTVAKPHVTPGATLAVVVNRVQLARELRVTLEKAFPQADVYLLTGRMRPYDRDRLEEVLAPRIRAGRARVTDVPPVIVVATQCIEAGADFDFDVLITECASLDALRQRFGRLDRLGRLKTSRGIIIRRKERSDDDPIYGKSLDATFAWLQAHEEGLDFGLERLRVPDDESLTPLVAPRLHAPVLLPGHLDSWVQTNPGPTPDPDVSLWLHGPTRSVSDVQIVWRADVTTEWLRACLGQDVAGEETGSARAGESALQRLIAVVDALPPQSSEAVAVPLAAARGWLAGTQEPDVADVEGVRAEDDATDIARAEPIHALVWRGDQSWVVSGDRSSERRGRARARGNRQEIVPGDTLVVPAECGGLGRAEGKEGSLLAATFDPEDRRTVVDIAELAYAQKRGRAVLRVRSETLPALLSKGLPVSMPSLEGLDDEVPTDQEIARSWLSGVESPATPEAARLFAHLKHQPKRGLRVERLPASGAQDGGEILFIAAREPLPFDYDACDPEVSTEDDRASFTGVEVTLADHLAGVAAFASRYAARLGLDERFVQDLALAARWHDAGKVDPRFQRWLHGGSEFRASVAREPLAKSRAPGASAAARRLARERAGYPQGGRHEFLSVALMESVDAALAPRVHDWDLMLHLVASHHGYARPFAPWVVDREPVEAHFDLFDVPAHASSAHGFERLDSRIPERFWALTARYGWWGLAWLETIFRLADHRQSEEEQRAGAASSPAAKAGALP